MRMRIHRAAKNEAEKAAEWYDDQRAGLGGELLEEIDAAYEQIEAHPHRPLRVQVAGFADREIHQRMLKRFPYKVIYEVTATEVIVIAIAHTRRKPNYWAKRM